MQAGSRRSDSFRREVAVKDWQTGHFAQDLPSRAIFSRRQARRPGWASRSRHAGRASGWHAPATPAARRPHRARRLRGHRSASPRPTAMALGCEVGWRHGARGRVGWCGMRVPVSPVLPKPTPQARRVGVPVVGRTVCRLPINRSCRAVLGATKLDDLAIFSTVSTCADDNKSP